MKKRNRILIIIAVVVAVAAAVIAYVLSRPTFVQDYHIEDTSSITKIFLADKEDNEVTLTREADSSWTVNGEYAANQPLVDLLLETLNTMRIRQQVNKNAVPNAIKDIAAHGIKVEIYQNEPWRSHLIVDLNVHDLQRIELEIPEQQEESFAIVRDGDGFAMEMLQSHQRVNGFDTARVAQMLSSFTWLNFDEFASIVPNTFADSCVQGQPRAILRITDTRGNQSEVKTYIKYNNPDDLKAMPDPNMYEVFDLNRLYAIVSHGGSTSDNPGDTVLIQYFVFDNILQPASYFLGADKTAFAR